MPRKIYDLAVPKEEYVDGNGDKKTKWQNCGVCLEKDEGGAFLLLDATVNYTAFERMPGSTSLLISMFKPRQDDKPLPKAEKYKDDDEDLPF